MTCLPLGATLDPVRQLFGGGATGGLDDRQLLERFLARGDEAAFAALVARHGPLVLSACRAILDEPADVEDAFQAAFLTLARRARSIRDRDALGAWLHRVARRVSIQANRDARRRRRREREAVAMSIAAKAHDPAARERAAALHEAIDRLPERLRRPLIACDLEGSSHEDAARSLGLSLRTLQRRLADARERLRQRLTRRGLAVGGPALAALLVREATAAVPESLLAATTRAAVGLAAGGATATALASARALGWSRDAAPTASALRIAALGSIALAAGVSAWVIGHANGPGRDAHVPRSAPLDGSPPVSGRVADGDGRPVAAADARFPAEPPRSGRTDAEGRFALVADDTPSPPRAASDSDWPRTVVVGRVVDADGRPVAGATARFDVNHAMAHAPEGPPPSDLTDAEGRFTLEAPAAAFAGYDPGVAKVRPRVVASAEGRTLGWAEVVSTADGLRPEVVVKLGRDDVPIEGRLINLEGQPVPGATVEVAAVFAPPDGEIEDWVAGRARIDQGPGQKLILVPASLRTTTDADGRFRFGGLGAGRVAEMYASGPGIVTTPLYAITRQGEPIAMEMNPALRSLTRTYHPARFEAAVAPSRPIVGTIRDAETGEGVPGVLLRGMPYEESSLVWVQHVEAVTDAEGRYRLDGLGVASKYRIFAWPTADCPYPPGVFVSETDAPPADPAELDFTLRRGVLVRGRLINARTGEPAQGFVQSFAFLDNPHVEDYPNDRGFNAFAYAGPDGSFAIPAIPGRNLLGARSDFHEFLPATGFESIEGLDPTLRIFRTVPQLCMPVNFQALVELVIEPGTEEVNRDLPLEPARVLRGTIVDEEGRPLDGGQSSGLNAMGWHAGRQRLDSAEFEALLPHEPKARQLMFWHPGRDLAGAVLLRGDETEPLTVTLRPWGTLTGRVVDDEGRPRKGVALRVVGRSPSGEGFGPFSGFDETVPVGDDGRFRADGIVPGLEYGGSLLQAGELFEGSVFSGLLLGPGEARDLGDLVPKPPEIE
jgi:RNA polymerase sigma factor (sigma-70 family)